MIDVNDSQHENAKSPIDVTVSLISIERTLANEEVRNDFTIYPIDMNDVIEQAMIIDKELESYVQTKGYDKITNLPMFVSSLSDQIRRSATNSGIRYVRLFHAYFRFLVRYDREHPEMHENILKSIRMTSNEYIPDLLRLPIWYLFLNINVNEVHQHYQLQ